MDPMKTIAVVFALAAIAAPTAFATKPPNTPHQTTTTTSRQSSPPTQAKAYGHYCKNQSKKHVSGQKGTPFSQCVTAMAKAAHGQSGKAACATMSKKHVAGERGTPFSRCVVAAAQLHKDQKS